MRALNLYSGIGGNRKLWPKSVEVTAVENNPDIAKIYKKLFPQDEMFIGDAHKFLLSHYKEFDFVWSSPPCPSHSRLSSLLKTQIYPDMSLWQEIIFLLSRSKKNFIVENVVPYYQPLIPPQVKISRHLFWSNKILTPMAFNNFPGQGSVRGEREAILQKLKWLGMGVTKDQLKGDFRTRQIVDNCVHPKIGLHLIQPFL